MHESLRINAKKLTEMKTFEVQHIFIDMPDALLIMQLSVTCNYRNGSFLKSMSGVKDGKTETNPRIFYDGRFLGDSVTISNVVTSLPVTSKERPFVVMSLQEISTQSLDWLSRKPNTPIWFLFVNTYTTHAIL